MSFVTQTQIQTVTAIPTDLTPSTTLSDVTITITTYLYTTLSATHGQTVTIYSPPSPPSLASSSSATTEYTPIIATTTETSTATVTELDVYLQDPRGSLYSTWIISLPGSNQPAVSSGPPSPWVYVVEPQRGGWDSWSKGAKAGLIVGVVSAALLLLAILLCCCKRRSIWLVHGWPPPPPVAPAPNPGPSIVQPTWVNGPHVPYNHGQPNPGYGYAQGLRGGGGGEVASERCFSGSLRDWFRKKQARTGT
ncbi:hypothetical protein A1O1_00344 [Capronia coronata CBS 617.96]|uniref:Mid2 domain-containing protein n=1 Tax=Capronia coronata CBS 617.96 TaxID=1182541 RepID=W9ZL23_9EURO|nr:uncharacterized protein A1O1_00344 [Capronia coronata CBS 617.96]EXJ95224.1 hypothetical protein A1O1_00344 [Capronia coronata CBS 617.96]